MFPVTGIFHIWLFTASRQVKNNFSLPLSVKPPLYKATVSPCIFVYLAYTYLTLCASENQASSIVLIHEKIYCAVFKGSELEWHYCSWFSLTLRCFLIVITRKLSVLQIWNDSSISLRHPTGIWILLVFRGHNSSTRIILSILKTFPGIFLKLKI